MLADAGEQEAADLAALVSEVVEAQRFAFDSSASVSASVGMTCFGRRGPVEAETSLARADIATYRAKTALAQRWGDATRPPLPSRDGKAGRTVPASLRTSRTLARLG